jgi:hypothetical protein
LNDIPLLGHGYGVRLQEGTEGKTRGERIRGKKRENKLINNRII